MHVVAPGITVQTYTHLHTQRTQQRNRQTNRQTDREKVIMSHLLAGMSCPVLLLREVHVQYNVMYTQPSVIVLPPLAESQGETSAHR